MLNKLISIAPARSDPVDHNQSLWWNVFFFFSLSHSLTRVRFPASATVWFLRRVFGRSTSPQPALPSSRSLWNFRWTSPTQRARQPPRRTASTLSPSPCSQVTTYHRQSFWLLSLLFFSLLCDFPVYFLPLLSFILSLLVELKIVTLLRAALAKVQIKDTLFPPGNHFLFSVYWISKDKSPHLSLSLSLTFLPPAHIISPIDSRLRGNVARWVAELNVCIRKWAVGCHTIKCIMIPLDLMRLLLRGIKLTRNNIKCVHSFN